MLYFAKRHRIVQIDFALLDKPGATFTITAFADARLTVQAMELATAASYGNSRQWKGAVIAPRLDVVAAAGVDSKQIAEQLNTVSFWSVNEPRDVPPGLRKELASASPQYPAVTNSPDSRSNADPSAVMKMRVPTLLGRWFQPALQSSLQIMPVPEDPRYHVVYEEDPGKTPQGKDFEERRRRYGDFRRTLEEERKLLGASPQP